MLLTSPVGFEPTISRISVCHLPELGDGLIMMAALGFEPKSSALEAEMLPDYTIRPERIERGKDLNL